MEEALNKVLYIINPAANGGAGIQIWEAFKSCSAEPIDPAHVVYTEHPGHASEIATTVEGYETIVAAGGDGTVSEVICGIMNRKNPALSLAVIPCGTGNDIARNAGIFSVSDAATALYNGELRAFDLIRITRQVDGHEEHRHAFLFANVGFSSIPMMKPWMKRLLGATGAYYLATMLQILAYRPPHMIVRVDGKEHTGPIYLVVAANTERAGGGCMRIAPGAITDDGMLNISIMKSASIYKVITRLFTCISKGTHINQPEVSYFTGRNIEVYSEPEAVLDLDGELFGTTPATISVCPRVLNLLCNDRTRQKR